MAATDLPAGAEVGPDDLRAVHWPSPLVPAGALSAEEIGDRRLASAIRAGEPLTDVRLVSPALLEGRAGEVAVPVRIPDGAVVALLRPGDLIDLIAADPTGAAPARRLAAGVVVLAVPPPDASGASAIGGRLVLLALSPDAARSVAETAVTSVISVTLAAQPAAADP